MLPLVHETTAGGHPSDPASGHSSAGPRGPAAPRTTAAQASPPPRGLGGRIRKGRSEEADGVLEVEVFPGHGIEMRSTQVWQALPAAEGVASRSKQISWHPSSRSL